ncbi:MAG TPA: inositol monophosphatase family protein [Candidatus Saccharimonadales bacterium]|jgi:myo-inositol-1(or 4)-monophosphatase|nr:inositol monophosphatase family protein [Candidatus Saccharimonadales bacterium]
MHGPELISNLATVARLAGKALLEAEDQKVSTQKTNSKDFVTAADLQLQEIITHKLHQLYPNLIVVSEELTEAERAPVYEHDFTGFVIDPIDGTYNFKHGMRESGISIGYIELGQALSGVIYDPYKDELFSAQKGKGAFRNELPISVSTHSDIAGASIATCNSYNDESMKRNILRQLSIYENSGHMPWMSCPGSAVLVMAGLACGRFDAFHHNSLKPWDNAVGYLLVREAGGTVLTLGGQEASFASPTVIAGNPAMVQQLQAIFQKKPELLS